MSTSPLTKMMNGIAALTGGTVRLDSFYNLVSGLGVWGRDPRTATKVKTVCPLTDVDITEAYHGCWLPAQIVDAIVDDALREGFSTESEDLDHVLEAWKAHENLGQLAKWSRAYGSAFLLLGTSDPDLTVPLTEVKAGGLQYVLVMDRRWVQVERRYQDRTNPKYTKPELYRVTPQGEDGLLSTPQAVIHETRLIRLDGQLTSPDMMARNAGWPLSVLQRPWDVIRDDDQTWASVTLLMRGLSTTVYAIKDFISQLTGEGPATLMARMSLVEQARSQLNAVMIDADMERFEQVGAANVSGVNETMKAFAQRVAGAARMPLSRLLGQQPGGLNATGESETRGWYDTVGGYQTHHLTEPARRFCAAIAQHSGITYDGTITWASLWQESPQQVAEREEKEQAVWRSRIESTELSAVQVGLHRIHDKPLEDLVPETPPADSTDRVAPPVGAMTTMQALLESAAAGKLPTEAAKAAIQVIIPSIDPTLLEAMFAGVEQAATEAKEAAAQAAKSRMVPSGSGSPPDGRGPAGEGDSTGGRVSPDK